MARPTERLSGPWGADESDQTAAVVVDGDRWFCVGRELCDAINAGRVATFNLYYSLAREAQERLSPCFFGVQIIK